MATDDTPERRDTTRQRASRIERDYYRRPSPFQRLRWTLVVTAVAAGAAWCAWGGFDPVRHHSPGAVAAPHARWESDCSACHVPLVPVKDGTWLSTPETRAAMDAKCESCHRGPAHHPLQVAAEVGSCASCHVDHRGRTNDLSAVGDATCVSCHGDIERHRQVVAGIAPAPAVGPIIRFDAAGHPPFASLERDPGTLRFSHVHHMLPGMSFAAAGLPEPAGVRGAVALKYDDPRLSEAARDRYRPAGAAADALVQLSCASCHEFAPAAGSRVLPAALTAAPPGAYALPIDFERHCAGCHSEQLRILPGSDAVVPHGLAAEPLRRAVEAAVLEEAVAAAPRPAEAPRPPRPLPAPAAEPLVDPDVVERARGRVAAARGLGEARCGLCHEVAPQAVSAGGPFAGAEPGAGRDWFAVAPANTPAVWFAKARFDHRPHRAFDCRECHAAAYPAPAASPAADPLVAALEAGAVLDDKARPMIAGRDSCTKCHAPTGGGSVEVLLATDAGKPEAASLPRGGAGHACVECHGYHGLGPHEATPGDLAGALGGRP